MYHCFPTESYLHKLCYYIRFVLGIKYWLKANEFINQTGYRKVKLHLAGYRKLPLYTGSSKNLRGSNLSYPSTLSKFSPFRPLTCMLHLSMLKYERKKNQNCCSTQQSCVHHLHLLTPPSWPCHGCWNLAQHQLLKNIKTDLYKMFALQKQDASFIFQLYINTVRSSCPIISIKELGKILWALNKYLYHTEPLSLGKLHILLHTQIHNGKFTSIYKHMVWCVKYTCSYILKFCIITCMYGNYGT